jgi:hypothetical protein
MKNIYFYSIWKHPLLWITFPLWLILSIAFTLSAKQGGRHRYR